MIKVTVRKGDDRVVLTQDGAVMSLHHTQISDLVAQMIVAAVCAGTGNEYPPQKGDPVQFN